MKMTNTEINVLKVMAEKDTDWTWMKLDRTLATRDISGFSNVAKILTYLMNDGMADTVCNEPPSKARYRVSEQGNQLVEQISKVITPSDIP